MHNIIKTLISIGVIDTPIKGINIDAWFQGACISFVSMDGTVNCHFIQCYEIIMKHDSTYCKNVAIDGSRDYEYFVHEIEIVEKRGFYHFNLIAWPLECQIVCKEIELK